MTRNLLKIPGAMTIAFKPNKELKLQMVRSDIARLKESMVTVGSKLQAKIKEREELEKEIKKAGGDIPSQ